jgi:hypothetical protein
MRFPIPTPLAVVGLCVLIAAGCTQTNGSLASHQWAVPGQAGPLNSDALPCVGLEAPVKPTPVVAFKKPAPARRIEPRTSQVQRPAGPWAVPLKRNWRYIVIHHSATDFGNAARFDTIHRRKGWDELGYHFIITNGQGGPDGAIQVGSRWRKQKHGAHCGGTPGNAYNEVGIGICLVGNFNDHMPSQAQLASLDDLVEFLATYCDIDPRNVIAHRDAPNAATDCCGHRLHHYLHATLRPGLASGRFAHSGR